MSYRYTNTHAHKHVLSETGALTKDREGFALLHIHVFVLLFLVFHWHISRMQKKIIFQVSTELQDIPILMGTFGPHKDIKACQHTHLSTFNCSFMFLKLAYIRSNEMCVASGWFESKATLLFLPHLLYLRHQKPFLLSDWPTDGTSSQSVSHDLQSVNKFTD